MEDTLDMIDNAFTKSRTRGPFEKQQYTLGREVDPSATADLALGNGLDPCDTQIESDGHDADNPDDLSVVLAIVPEDDGEDDASQISTRSSDTRYNA